MGDVGQLKGSISSNIVIPICSAFFTRNTALRSLSGHNASEQDSGSGRRRLVSRWFLSLRCPVRDFKLPALPRLPSLSWLLCLFVFPPLNFHSSRSPSRPRLESWKEVVCIVELGNRVSRIYPFNLASEPARLGERGSHSFSLEWWNAVEQFYSVCLFIDK